MRHDITVEIPQNYLENIEERLERYEHALKSIAGNNCCDGCREAAKVASLALSAERHDLPFHEETLAGLASLTIRKI